MTRSLRLLLCAFCLFPLGTSIASAADLQPAEQPPAAKAGWVFQVTPYLWAAGEEQHYGLQ
jgi:hypothetical protein